MNEQNLGGGFYRSDTLEGTDQNTSSPAVNPDPFADRVPVDPALIHETPMGGTLAAIPPMSNNLADEKVPMYETPVQQIPMAGTVAVVGPLNETVVPEAPIGVKVVSPAALLDREVSEHLRTRWNEIQGKFVDEPRSAVQQADTLVSEVVAQITQMFASEHSSLEGQWNQGNDVSTEDLRKALQRYRSFFNRLVV